MQRREYSSLSFADVIKAWIPKSEARVQVLELVAVVAEVEHLSAPLGDADGAPVVRRQGGDLHAAQSASELGRGASPGDLLPETVDLLRLGHRGVEGVLLERRLVRNAQPVEVGHDDDGGLLEVDGGLLALGVLEVLEEALRRAHVLVVVPLDLVDDNALYSSGNIYFISSF